MERYMGLALILFILAGCIAYFGFIKPWMDKRKEVVVVVPTIKEKKNSEKGNYLGTGNPTVKGPRPLWKFSQEGPFYGNGFQVWIGGKLSFDVPDCTRRCELADGRLFKPVSDVLPRGCAVHDAGGSAETVCEIRW